jgi:hypothetical protein
VGVRLKWKNRKGEGCTVGILVQREKLHQAYDESISSLDALMRLIT